MGEKGTELAARPLTAEEGRKVAGIDLSNRVKRTSGQNSARNITAIETCATRLPHARPAWVSPPRCSPDAPPALRLRGWPAVQAAL